MLNLKICGALTKIKHYLASGKADTADCLIIADQLRELLTMTETGKGLNLIDDKARAKAMKKRETLANDNELLNSRLKQLPASDSEGREQLRYLIGFNCAQILGIEAQYDL